jgi:hypothetical protein
MFRVPALTAPSKAPVPTLACLLVLASSMVPARAGASEFSVHAETIGQAYRIRGRDGLFSIPRTRITQLLYFSATDLLSRAHDPGSPMDLSLVVNLGVDHDFSVPSGALKPGADGFVPLLARTRVGMFTGYLSGSFGTDPGVRFKLGRMVLTDPTGFVALDGGELQVRLARLLRLGCAMGLSLLPDVRLSMVDFSPEGVAWGDRKGYPEDLHPEVIEPRPRPVIVTWLALDVPSSGTLTLSYRRTWSDPDFDDVALERVGLGLSLSGHDRPVSLELRSAYDLVWERMAELWSRFRVRPRPHFSFGLRFLHLVPLFDASSIFNVFDMDPHDELGVFFDIGRRASVVSLSAGSGLRLTNVDEDGDGRPDRLSDINGMLVVHVRRPPLRVTWTARGSGGQSGVLAGSTARASLTLLDGRLVPSAGVGLWFWNDPLRREHHGLTGGGSAALTCSPVDVLSLVAGADLFHNRVSGTGLRITVRAVVDL